MSIEIKELNIQSEIVSAEKMNFLDVCNEIEKKIINRVLQKIKEEKIIRTNKEFER